MKEQEEQEEYRDIPGYEGLYQVSNFGNVKSLEREVSNGKGTRIIKERILKTKINNNYYMVTLFKNSNKNKYIGKGFLVHQLVAMSFLNHKPNGFKIVVDHINNIKTDNRLDNLQLISHRKNISKDQFRHNRSSKYVGVNLRKEKYTKKDGTISIYKSWKASIYINGKTINLGTFKTEEEAHEVYQNKLKEISELH